MFDPRYLDTLEEDVLLQLYDSCRSAAKRNRRQGSFGLYHWWNDRAAECCNALGRLYLENTEIYFSREQMELDAMPPRIAPDLRRAN